MRTRARRPIGAILVLIASALTANALADLQSSATAMACCAKTKYECARLRGPDDCCQHMGHTAGRIAVATYPSVDYPGPTAGAIGPALLLDLPASGRLNSRPELKRPHDPPHLHQYNPLI